MEIAVLGASGGVGRHVVDLAADRGHRVVAIVRPSNRIARRRRVEVCVEEDPTTVEAVERACANADVIVSAIGQRRARPWNPWSKLISPENLCEGLGRSLATVDKPMVVVSAAGVGDSRSKTSPLLRFLFDYSTIGRSYRDLERFEAELGSSRCVCVRPTTLTRGGAKTSRRVERYGLFSRISRRAVAAFIIETAETSDFDGFEAAMISD